MMTKRIVLLLFFAVLLGLSACGVLQEPEEASAPLEAIPLEVAPTETAVMQESVVEEAEEATAAEPAAPQEPTTAETTGGTVVYTITPGESQVRFELDEDLRGSRITVVGTTDQVAGQIGVDLANLAATQVGVLQINARTLATDNNFRNRAIQNEILNTGSYEFITFTPTAVTGLPANATIGDTLTFTIEGELTIRDVTAPATFEVTATAVSDNQITGTATTTILRETYGLTIPSVPNVANVEEEVELYIEFIANAS